MARTCGLLYFGRGFCTAGVSLHTLPRTVFAHIYINVCIHTPLRQLDRLLTLNTFNLPFRIPFLLRMWNTILC